MIVSRYTCLRYKSTYNLFYFSVSDWLNTPGLISRQEFLDYIIVVGNIEVNGSIDEVCCAELLQWNFLFWPTRDVLHCTVLCCAVLYLYEKILSETIAWYQYVLQTDLNNIAICKFVAFSSVETSPVSLKWECSLHSEWVMLVKLLICIVHIIKHVLFTIH